MRLFKFFLSASGLPRDVNILQQFLSNFPVYNTVLPKFLFVSFLPCFLILLLHNLFLSPWFVSHHSLLLFAWFASWFFFFLSFYINSTFSFRFHLSSLFTFITRPFPTFPSPSFLLLLRPRGPPSSSSLPSASTPPPGALGCRPRPRSGF